MIKFRTMSYLRRGLVHASRLPILIFWTGYSVVSW